MKPVRLPPLLRLLPPLLAAAFHASAIPQAAAQPAAQLGDANPAAVEAAPGKKTVLPPLAPERAPAASPRGDSPRAADLPRLASNFFDAEPGRRAYLQVDKPLYKPGETIWFKTWDLKTRALSAAAIDRTKVELISPKGVAVLSKWLQVAGGSASNEFDLPAEAQGGEYTLRATADDGTRTERAVIVAGYEAPRMKKKLEFTRKAYGAGDSASATFELRRPTGEALGGKRLTAVVTVDGIELPRVTTSTNAEGGALVRFDLPKTINVGDGLLTVLVEDGGVTESISKPIPILQKKLSLAFFPEGGSMVAGLPTRLYFEAKTLLGKPADVEGRLLDDLGNPVAKFATYKNGLGRIDFTPATGRSYQAEISRPSSVTEKYALPLVEATGCVLRSYDDFDGQEPALRVAVRCSEPQKVVVAATMRENVLDVATVMAAGMAGSGSPGTPGAPGVVYLRAKDAALNRAAGVARITVLDQDLNTLAERLVFRNRRAQLQVKVEPDRKSYAPRGKVALAVRTLDPAGNPVAAELALSVVDDTVVSFADDKAGHLLSKLLLEPELPGKIEEPNFYTDLTEAKSGQALDLLMGARGYRRFDWVKVVNPRQKVAGYGVQITGSDITRAEAMAVKPRMVPPPQPSPLAPPPPPPLAALAVAHAPAPPAVAEVKKEAPPVQMVEAKPMMPMPVPAPKPLPRGRRGDNQDADEAAQAATGFVADRDFAKAAKRAPGAGGQAMRLAAPPIAQVRVFPVPAFQPDYAGPRDDYRETVFWMPSLKTDSQGKASVQFVLSDAVTSFRVFSEGVGGGAAGRDETVFKSSLPFSLSAKLPLEVSAGDRPLIPVTLSNDSANSLDVALDAQFGSLIQSTGDAAKGGALKGGKLAAGQRKSLFIPLEVTGVRGESVVRLAAASGGLKDEVLRSIPVAPLGFPQLWQVSGTLTGGNGGGKGGGKGGAGGPPEASHSFDISHANPGSVQATVRVYTSPLSTMISGLDGMLREPSGCFEQTSSTNYPNVMIMQYLKQHDVADPALLERSGRLLSSGYKKLTGFESKNKGYEWFGGDPGHEALTAYGLLEFSDMKGLGSEMGGEVDGAMLARTGAWLKSRRDGNGGYLRDAKALDSFGRASPEVTDAYITWALVSAGETGLEKEIAKSARLAESTQDAYQLALAAGTLLHGPAKAAPSKAGLAAAGRLAKMQEASGAWTNASHSITRSGGLNLQIESTALSVLALLKTGQHLEPARRGIAWLQANRGGFGQWGATQATVLALKAVIAYDDATRVAPSSGVVTLLVDGVPVGEQAYDAGRREPLVFSGFDAKLAPGRHSITLRAQGGGALPYSVAVEYRSTNPASSEAAVLDLTASLGKAQVKMGETVRLDATLRNKTKAGQPMTLARLGLPGGLTFQTWQLKELREKGQIAFFETRPREVILYFRDVKPGEVKKLALDLVATVPGSYTGPASSAYLYYNDSDKSWAAPLAVKIEP